MQNHLEKISFHRILGKRRCAKFFSIWRCFLHVQTAESQQLGWPCHSADSLHDFTGSKLLLTAIKLSL